MKKYDCSKVLDYLHEIARICTVYTKCEGCPLKNINCSFVHDITQEHVNIVQKWSDEHPEMPKITIEERNFLEAFKNEGLIIARYGSGLRLTYGRSWTDLRGTMFSFIHINQPWTIGELLMLEVEE